MRRHYFGKGSCIFLKGDPSENFYVIQKGTIDLTLDDECMIPFVRIKEGYFGEFELIKDIPRLFTAVSSSNSTVYSIEKAEFFKLFLNEKNRE